MIGITNELPEKDERYELHRLICALLSNQVQGNQKFDILEKEYNIPTNTELREDVRSEFRNRRKSRGKR